MDFSMRALELIQEKNLVHSNINPFNFIITETSEKFYKIMGLGALYQYCQKDQRIFFSRNIEKIESHFIAPEIIETFENKTENMLKYRLSFQWILTDIFTYWFLSDTIGPLQPGNALSLCDHAWGFLHLNIH